MDTTEVGPGITPWHAVYQAALKQKQELIKDLERRLKEAEAEVSVLQRRERGYLAELADYGQWARVARTEIHRLEDVATVATLERDICEKRNAHPSP